MDVGSLQVNGIIYRKAPSDSGYIGTPLPREVLLVSNRATSSADASAAGMSARQPPSLSRELRGALCGGRDYLYIGDSSCRRIGFDTFAIAHSRPGDRAHEKAEFKIALLEDRCHERELAFQQAATDAARGNGKRMIEILAVNSRRLLQAQVLKARLGDALSSQIRLDGLINLYKSFSVGITNGNPPAPGTSTQAVTRR